MGQANVSQCLLIISLNVDFADTVNVDTASKEFILQMLRGFEKLYTVIIIHCCTWTEGLTLSFTVIFL